MEKQNGIVKRAVMIIKITEWMKNTIKWTKMVVASPWTIHLAQVDLQVLLIQNWKH